VKIGWFSFARPPPSLAGPVSRLLVVLANCRGAGTDANVFLELQGEAGTLGPCRLDSAVNNFERNQRDTFPLHNCTCIGKIIKAVVWHDNSGFLADWHLAQVEVKGPGVLGDPSAVAKAEDGGIVEGNDTTGAAGIEQPNDARSSVPGDAGKEKVVSQAAFAAEQVAIFPVHRWLRKNEKEGLAGCRVELTSGERVLTGAAKTL
jgi:hypothetical protein